MTTTNELTLLELNSQWLNEVAENLTAHGIKIKAIEKHQSKNIDSSIDLGNGIAVDVPFYGRTAHVAITVLRDGGWLSSTMQATRQEDEFADLLADIKKAQESKK